MARPISDEELQLKKRARRRLVGAIVLVTAVAVVLPMVLDSEPRPVSQNVDIQIPSPDSGEFKPKGSAAGSHRQHQGTARSQAPRPLRRRQRQTGSAAAADRGAAAAPASSRPDERRKRLPKAAEAKAARRGEREGACEERGERTARQGRRATAAGAYVVQVAALADAAQSETAPEADGGGGLENLYRSGEHQVRRSDAGEGGAVSRHAKRPRRPARS